MVGQEIGCSSWTRISQEMIDIFAELTNDNQFIHVDPERAKSETSYGGTIVHGFLCLSLASQMVRSAIPRIKDINISINYGFDKIRFVTPVPSGSDIRGRFKLMAVDERKPKEFVMRYEMKIEIRGGDRPAIFAEWLVQLNLQ